MAQITIRNLDDSVLLALKRRATEAGHSTEEEARRCLAAATGVDRQAALARLTELRARIQRVDGEADAAVLIRQMRDERALRFDQNRS